MAIAHDQAHGCFDQRLATLLTLGRQALITAWERYFFRLLFCHDQTQEIRFSAADSSWLRDGRRLLVRWTCIDKVIHLDKS